MFLGLNCFVVAFAISFQRKIKIIGVLRNRKARYPKRKIDISNILYSCVKTEAEFRG